MIKLVAHKESGFSLVEVIIGIFIIGMIVLVLSNIPNAINLVTTSQSESKVREVTAKKIEDLRLLGYTGLANGTTSFSDSKLSGLTNVSGNVLISDCSTEPTLCPNEELAKKVTVTITWNENTEPKRFSVTTLISQGGLR